MLKDGILKMLNIALSVWIVKLKFRSLIEKEVSKH